MAKVPWLKTSKKLTPSAPPINDDLYPDDLMPDNTLDVTNQAVDIPVHARHRRVYVTFNGSLVIIQTVLAKLNPWFKIRDILALLNTEEQVSEDLFLLAIAMYERLKSASKQLRFRKSRNAEPGLFIIDIPLNTKTVLIKTLEEYLPSTRQIDRNIDKSYRPGLICRGQIHATIESSITDKQDAVDYTIQRDIFKCICDKYRSTTPTADY